MGAIPGIDDVELEWLAAQLGIDADGELRVQPVGSGQVANCHRLTMTASDGTHVHVIAKSPSLDEVSRSTAAMQHLYLRETSFYRELADSITTRTPECFFVERNEDDDFLILLEDMSPARDVDQFDGLDLEMAKRGLEQLAGLHGPTTGRADVHDAAWLGGVAQNLKPLYDAVLPALFQGFLERYVDDIDQATTDFVAYLGEHLGAFTNYEVYAPCVTHGDFRTDNLLFDAKGGEVPLCVVDWQTIGVGSQMLDVAYFLTTSLTTDERERHEDELLDYYLEQLSTHGVELPRDVARSEFARYTLQPVVMLVCAAVLVERTERGDRMFLSMIERGIAAATKWNAFAEMSTHAPA
jgi:hypothetical protein